MKKVKVGVLFFCKPATHLLYKQIFRRSMIFLTLVCTKRLSIYSNFFRMCLMGKRVDVSENLEATFVLSKFSFFFNKTRLFLVRTTVHSWINKQEEIRRAEMRKEKWSGGLEGYSSGKKIFRLHTWQRSHLKGLVPFDDNFIENFWIIFVT